MAHMLQVSDKQRYLINDELETMLLDVFGWTIQSDDEDDALDELTHKVASAIQALIPSNEDK